MGRSWAATIRPGSCLGAAQVMLNGWFPQATTNNNLRIELVYFP